MLVATKARRRTAVAIAAAIALTAGTLAAVSVQPADAATGATVAGRTLSAPQSSTTIRTIYGEGTIMPVTVTKTDAKTDISGHLYWVVNGTPWDDVAVSNTSGEVYLQEKPFSPKLAVNGKHKVELYYCPSAGDAERGCPPYYNYSGWDKSQWITLTRTIDVVKVDPIIIISMNQKVVQLADLKDGSKKVSLYVMVGAAGLKGEEANLKGTMQVKVNGAKAGSPVAVKPIEIPGTKSKKPAIQTTIDASKFPKAGNYAITILYKPDAASSGKFVNVVTSSKRTLQVTK